MASSFTRHIRTYKAGGTINVSTFVKFDAAAETVVACGANERAIGIAQNAAVSGGLVEVALPGGGGTLKVAGTIAKGKILTSDANGKGAVADAAGEWVGAVAYDSGVADDVIDVMVAGFQAQGSDV